MFSKLKVEITRFVDDSQPGWVECCFVDAYQHEWLFVEKIPVVTLAYLDAESTYPNRGEIACRVLEKTSVGNQKIVKVDTSEPWGINSICGETQFEVFPDQLEEE